MHQHLLKLVRNANSRAPPGPTKLLGEEVTTSGISDTWLIYKSLLSIATPKLHSPHFPSSLPHSSSDPFKFQITSRKSPDTTWAIPSCHLWTYQSHDVILGPEGLKWHEIKTKNKKTRKEEPLVNRLRKTRKKIHTKSKLLQNIR